jgi:hypothetical protein
MFYPGLGDSASKHAEFHPDWGGKPPDNLATLPQHAVILGARLTVILKGQYKWRTQEGAFQSEGLQVQQVYRRVDAPEHILETFQAAYRSIERPARYYG